MAGRTRSRLASLDTVTPDGTADAGLRPGVSRRPVAPGPDGNPVSRPLGPFEIHASLRTDPNPPRRTGGSGELPLAVASERRADDLSEASGNGQGGGPCRR